MGGMFAPYQPDQAHLFPPSARQWLPDDHPVYFLIDTVSQLDLSKLERAYRPEGSGNVAYHPRLMLTLLIYGYISGIVSSRKIARAIDENIAFRVIAAGQRPGHRTIARFRERHIGDFQSIFAQVVKIAAEAGLVDLKTLAIDGTKISASASCKKSMRYKSLRAEDKRLRQEIAKLIDRARDTDEAEDELYGEDKLGDELPAELADHKTRQKKIREAIQRIEERQREADAGKIKADEERRKSGKKRPGPKTGRPPGTPSDKTQDNLTDPDSRAMKFSNGTYGPGFNAQIAVDAANQIIVGTDVNQNATDHGLLVPMAAAAELNVGKKPKTVVADAGYRVEDDFAKMEASDIDAYVALGNSRRPTPKINSKLHATLRMAKKVATQKGRQLLATRGHIAEAPFSWIKRRLGFTSFSLRSHRKCHGEWALVCLALNLGRMKRLMA